MIQKSFPRYGALGALCALLVMASFYCPDAADAANGSTLTMANPNLDVQFGPSRKFDDGVQSSVTLHSSGLVLEFHKSQNNDGIWYHVARLNGMSVTWGPSRDRGVNDNKNGNGYWPTVAMSKEGYVVLVRSSRESRNGSLLKYRIGKIDPLGSHTQSITWLTNDNDWDAGFHTSIAINDNGIIVGVHESSDQKNNNLHYRVGHLRNPTAGDYAIQWDSGHGGIHYDGGINPHIAINNNSEIVEVHQVPGGQRLHYRRGTLVRNITGGLNINFRDSQIYDDNAERPAVALLDDGFVLEVHSKNGLSTRAGWLSTSNSAWIEWAPAKDDEKSISIEYPAVAARGIYAIQTHQYLSQLFFSTSAIRDRANWMGDNLSWIGDQSLKEIAIPGSHDAGMYRASTITGNGGLTQDQSIYQQLRGGVRYFDLRVLGGNPQYIYHGYALIKGPPVQEILDDVRRFMQEGHKEAVILKFSHFKDFNKSEYTNLESMIRNTIFNWMVAVRKGCDPDPARTPLNELLQTGGKVIVCIDERWASDIACNLRKGFFVFRNSAYSPGDNVFNTADGEFNVYDVYSNTLDFDYMVADQMKKYNDYNGRMTLNPYYECDLFLLSWTLTPVTDVKDVILTTKVNRDLANAMNSVDRNRYGLIPNILYVDYYQTARVTDTAISMTERFLNAQ